MSQREAEELWGPVMAGTADTLVCKGHSADLPPVVSGLANERDNPGFNPYVLQRLIDQTDSSKDDPRPALKRNKTPAILLFGECNYIPWKVTGDYRRTFADLKVVYFPGGGHYIQFGRAQMLSRVIRGFLLDQPQAIPVYTDTGDPRLSAQQH